MLLPRGSFTASNNSYIRFFISFYLCYLLNYFFGLGDLSKVLLNSHTWTDTHTADFWEVFCFCCFFKSVGRLLLRAGRKPEPIRSNQEVGEDGSQGLYSKCQSVVQSNPKTTKITSCTHTHSLIL